MYTSSAGNSQSFPLSPGVEGPKKSSGNRNSVDSDVASTRTSNNNNNNWKNISTPTHRHFHNSSNAANAADSKRRKRWIGTPPNQTDESPGLSKLWQPGSPIPWGKSPRRALYPTSNTSGFGFVSRILSLPIHESPQRLSSSSSSLSPKSHTFSLRKSTRVALMAFAAAMACTMYMHWTVSTSIVNDNTTTRFHNNEQIPMYHPSVPNKKSKKNHVYPKLLPKNQTFPSNVKPPSKKTDSNRTHNQQQPTLQKQVEQNEAGQRYYYYPRILVLQSKLNSVEIPTYWSLPRINRLRNLTFDLPDPLISNADTPPTTPIMALVAQNETTLLHSNTNATQTNLTGLSNVTGDWQFGTVNSTTTTTITTSSTDDIFSVGGDLDLENDMDSIPEDKGDFHTADDEESGLEQSCQPAASWQQESHPNCNTFYEYIDLNHFDSETGLKFLGSGWFRSAWRLDRSLETNEGRTKKDKKEEESLVLKTLRLEREFLDEYYELHRRDAIAMEHLTFSSHIMDVYGYCGQSALNELAEFMADLASLEKLVRRMRGHDNDHVLILKVRLALSVAVGLYHVHYGIPGYPWEHGDHNTSMPLRASMAHYDINPRNIAIVAGGKPKINDFNIAEFLTYPNENSTETCGFPSRLNEPWWRAPEEMDTSGQHPMVNEKVDVYALGNVLFQILTTHSPHGKMKKERMESVRDFVRQGNRPSLMEPWASRRDPIVRAFRAALDLCFEPDPQKRGTSGEVATILYKALAEKTGISLKQHSSTKAKEDKHDHHHQHDDEDKHHHKHKQKADGKKKKKDH